MRANPGGQVDPADVVGRDKLIERLWDVLDRQSVVLTAERRMGKTCVIHKMQAEGGDGRLTVYRDLEKVHRPLEFVEAVFQDVEGYLRLRKKVAFRVRQFIGSLGGAEVGDVFRFPASAATHWKKLLTMTLEDLAEHQEHLVVLFWDELPSMVKNICDRCGEDVASELLDTLRALRQTHGKLRMLYSGSIGLHNAISTLKSKGYTGAPTTCSRSRCFRWNRRTRPTWRRACWPVRGYRTIRRAASRRP